MAGAWGQWSWQKLGVWNVYVWACVYVCACVCVCVRALIWIYCLRFFILWTSKISNNHFGNKHRVIGFFILPTFP